MDIRRSARIGRAVKSLVPQRLIVRVVELRDRAAGVRLADVGGDRPAHVSRGGQRVRQFVGQLQRGNRHLHVDHILGVQPGNSRRSDVVDADSPMPARGVEPRRDPTALSGHDGSLGTRTGADSRVDRCRGCARTAGSADARTRGPARPIPPGCPSCRATHRRRRGAAPRVACAAIRARASSSVKPRSSISRFTRSVLVRVDDHHQRKHGRHTGFHEQRNVLDDDGIVGRGGDHFRAAMRHQWMHDPIQASASRPH